jgi:hypothetical protein
MVANGERQVVVDRPRRAPWQPAGYGVRHGIAPNYGTESRADGESTPHRTASSCACNTQHGSPCPCSESVPDQSQQRQKGWPTGVEVNPPVRVLVDPRLEVGAAGAEGQDLGLGLVDVVDGDVDVELLAVLRAGPVGRLVVRGPLEAEEHVPAVA